MICLLKSVMFTVVHTAFVAHLCLNTWIQVKRYLNRFRFFLIPVISSFSKTYCICLICSLYWSYQCQCTDNYDFKIKYICWNKRLWKWPLTLVVYSSLSAFHLFIVPFSIPWSQPMLHQMRPLHMFCMKEDDKTPANGKLWSWQLYIYLEMITSV